VVGAWAADVSEGALTEAEREAAGRIAQPAAREHYVGARGTARRLLAGWLGVAPADLVIGRRCPRCGSAEHGAPCVRGVPLSISVAHSGGLVLCAVAALGRVGIDVEELRPVPEESAAHVVSPQDRCDGLDSPTAEQLFAVWVLKEAATKLTGAGLATRFSGVAVRALQREYTVVSLDSQLPSGYVGALAADAEPGPLHWLELPPA